MPKSAVLGNGKTLICFDRNGLVKDIYYHYPGLENHVGSGFVHKIGVYVGERLYWIDEGGWDIKVSSEVDTMATDFRAINREIGIELHFSDILYNEANIFIRDIKIKNTNDSGRRVKVFFNQQFNISQTHIGDTAYYDPREEVIIHYKGRRVFLFNALCDNERFDEYSVGLIGIEGKGGTYKDAEDGYLSKNAIEHGQVDSVFGMQVDIEPKSETQIFYWMTIGKSINKVKELNQLVMSRRPSDIIKTTKDYWHAWVTHLNFSFYGLGEPIINMFRRSLLNIRTHVATNGSIIASGDSDLFQFGRDTYAYVWPRDAAFSALALERAGDFNASRRFFRFARKIITNEGYFMHKYAPDLSLGSSWHPWVRNGEKQFPIQEDETALVIYALWKHYELSHDLEFIEGIYNDLIKKAAEFMVGYRDGKTGLPSPSYDLWEQDYTINTFTASTVYKALVCAGKFAKLLGKDTSAQKYTKTSEEIKKAILKYLYDKETGLFYKQIKMNKSDFEIDKTVDISSVYGVFKFEVLETDDPKLEHAFEKTVERLECKTEVGGIARYEGDSYHARGGNIPGNPWIITTMWAAQYFIAKAKNESDMEPVRKYISWVVKYGGESMVLPEQIDPYSGEHLSAAPLTWSHGEFVNTIIAYLEKLEDLGICKACYPVS